MYAVCPIVAAVMSEAPTGRWPTERTPEAATSKIASLVPPGSPPPNMYVSPVDLRGRGVVQRERQPRDFVGAGAVDHDGAGDRGIARVEAADGQGAPRGRGHGGQLHCGRELASRR